MDLLKRIGSSGLEAKGGFGEVEVNPEVADSDGQTAGV